ncbi:uncharacterized protein LOC62_02G001900 [Vanrija pseudolonga]|uniref:Uncharacterized protein n=1 Tax=Vanrija pseudolonga TaxID=143232 RepID=A0AAF0Y7M9_9TREE|nr:hypothetical protein LOC62_02G001900 [Vanrija pseudolonga]
MYAARTSLEIAPILSVIEADLEDIVFPINFNSVYSLKLNALQNVTKILIRTCADDGSQRSRNIRRYCEDNTWEHYLGDLVDHFTTDDIAQLAAEGEAAIPPRSPRWEDLPTSYSEYVEEELDKLVNAPGTECDPVLALIERNLDNMLEAAEEGGSEAKIEVLTAMTTTLLSTCISGKDPQSRAIRKYCDAHGWGDKIIELVDAFTEDDMDAIGHEDGGEYLPGMSEEVREARAPGTYSVLKKVKQAWKIIKEEAPEVDDDPFWYALLGDAPTTDVRSLLLDAAVAHPDVGEQLAVYAKAHAPDAVGVVGVSALPGRNFDRYAVAARTVLGLLYESKRETYDQVTPALLDIEASLDDMVDRVQTGEYRLILSALENMCRIFGAVCSLGEGKLGKETRRIVVKNRWGAKITEVVDQFSDDQFSDDDYVRLAAEDNGWWVDKHFAPAVHYAETFGMFDEVIQAYEELLGRTGLDSDSSVEGESEGEDSGIVMPSTAKPATSRAHIRALLETMDASTLRALLLEGWEYPAVARRIEVYAEAQKQREAAATEAKQELEASPPINFDEHAADAAFHLGDKYAREPPRIQVNKAFDVARHVEHLLDDIVDRTRAHANWGTKLSAATNIRRVYDALLSQRHDDYIPQQVRSAATWWGQKMGAVLGLFSPAELDKLSDEEGGSWFQKLRVLARKAKTLGTLDGLEDEVGTVFVRVAAGSTETEEAREEGRKLLRTQWEATLSRIPPESMRDLLVKAALEHKEMAKAITAAATVENFDYYGTKLSAVENMRKIFEALCTSEGDFPDKVRSYVNRHLGAEMVKVLRGFSAKELDQLASHDIGGTKWIDKLHELAKIAEAHSFLKLEKVVHVATGGELEKY